MYARVVRFTDVNPERIEEIKTRVSQEEGPPEGVPSTGFRVYYDESQGTAVFVGYFASEEDMKAGSEVLDQMDPSETPGTRASVDMCEVTVEVDA
jgi:hypothetical protein